MCVLLVCTSASTGDMKTFVARVRCLVCVSNAVESVLLMLIACCSSSLLCYESWRVVNDAVLTERYLMVS